MSYIDKPPIEDFLMHYGKGHLDGGNSGRYPWGSGDSPFQHSGDFLSRVKELRKQGLNSYYDEKTGKTYTGEAAIAAAVGLFDMYGKPSTSELRLAERYANNERKMAEINRIEALRTEGYGYSEIARKMGLPNESSVRSKLEPIRKENLLQAQNTADYIRSELEKKLEKDPKAMIDIGKDVERELNISREKLDDAIYILEGEGYKTLGGRVPQVTDPTGNKQTTINVIAGPEATAKDFYDYEHLYSLKDYISRDNGETYEKRFEYPASMDSNRLMIRYAEDGGKDKDGVIELKRNIPDLSLGESNYAQVRILVDNDKYLKGMAVYSDDKNFPPGVDVIFNTNKGKDVAKMDVLKQISDDEDNPFGSLIKDSEQGGQYYYDAKTGARLESKNDSPNAKLGLINKRSDEGDWKDWQDTLSAQFLSKQPEKLAKRQLDLAVVDKKQEFNDIMNLNNNTVKKYYLESFANDCDSAAEHLKAAALPRQKFQVILPLTTIKDNEIYAPNFNNGEKVALIRYPHGGIFEIPICTVNNNNREGSKLISKNGTDAVGISPSTAERLSGADFDGDTVLVVPTHGGNGINISSKPRLKGMLEPDGTYFDPKTRYKTTKKDGKYYNSSGVEVKIMDNTQTQMGIISNLITDMTIKGASDDELARAVRHSMVVIDAEKHKLDYRSSEQENGIDALKRKYQKKVVDGEEKYGGASTLISRSKSEVEVTKRQGQPKINIKGTPQYDPTKPEGALIFKEKSEKDVTYYQAKIPTGEKNQKGKMIFKTVNVYPKEDGGYKYISEKKKDSRGNIVNTYKDLPIDIPVKVKERKSKSTQMAETTDARSLISDYDSKIENIYADYANTMKSLANEARKALYFTKGVEYSPSAAKVYEKEVKDLKNKLDISEKNRPRERLAQAIAYSNVTQKKEANPGMNKKQEKKIRQQELVKARDRVGASRKTIDISDREWEAIQSGALHANTLTKILNHADMDKIKERATPREYKTLNTAQISRAKSMANNGKTNAEIAAALGVSASTISGILNEG